MAEIDEDLDGDKGFPEAPMTGEAVSAFLTAPTGAAVTPTEWNSSTNQTSWGTTEYRIQYATPQAIGNFNYEKKEKSGRTEISATLCFKFIKSKLSMIESAKFKARMRRLEKMVDEFNEVGQVAMAEQCVLQFMKISRESAMWACGIKYWITKEHAEKFRYSLKKGQDLKITNLENFGRVMPKAAIVKLKKCHQKKLFDKYVIFHLDARGKSTAVETVKQKVERERDPILFGIINECPDQYYFIHDWVDELDDLRFGDIIKALSLDKNNISLKTGVSMEEVKKAIRRKL
jgi:hypothetical protein